MTAPARESDCPAVDRDAPAAGSRPLLQLAHRRGQEVQLVDPRVRFDVCKRRTPFEHVDQVQVLGDRIGAALRHARKQRRADLRQCLCEPVGVGEERVKELLGVLNYTSAPFGTEEYQLYNYGVEGKHYTLKERTLARTDLDEFVACYKPGNRHNRKTTWSDKHPEGRWREYSYEDLVARDKVSLDLFWLRDESLEDSANLPDPNLLAEEIAEDLRAALEQIEEVLADLRERVSK